MHRFPRLLLALIAATLPVAAFAIDYYPTPCPGGPPAGTVVAMVPAAPTDEDEITVCFYDYVYSDFAAIDLRGNQLTVTYYDNGFSWSPNPPVTLAQRVGPLAAGTYQMRVVLTASWTSGGALGYPRTVATDIPITVAKSDVDASQPSHRAVEYYNQAFDHYFITTLRVEMRDLDSGSTKGWQRTGRSFLVHTDPSASPVCRFYIPPAQGDSHFYSASPAECATVAAQHPEMILETSDLFRAALPGGNACGAGDVPVYRLWNKREDSNHRYTTDRGLRDQMVKAGYFSEGSGADRIAMCVPLR